MITDEYYSKNSEQYILDTKNRPMTEIYAFFEAYLPKNAKSLLELGFGCGRDSLYFQNTKGLNVTSLDQCEEFCQHGEKIGLKQIIHQNIQDMNFSNEFDGIWACASLLHIPSVELKDVFRKCALALKEHGAMYCSFKYGDFEGERTDRYYHDVTEESLKEFVNETGLSIKDILITYDKRKEPYVKWLNVILIKD